MAIDAILIRRKITLITPDLSELEKLSQRTLEDFVGDIYAETLAERFIERIVGRTIDVNFHIVTKLGEPPPRDYYSSFLAMAKVGVVPPALAGRVAPAAGGRSPRAHHAAHAGAAWRCVHLRSNGTCRPRGPRAMGAAPL